MARTEFLDAATLWPRLRQLARRARGRRLIATPYIGDGGARLLPLRRGDILVCALSLQNCRSGSVWPDELRKLRRRGVLLYSVSDLHAKVYLFGSAAIVGSANLSRHSRDELDEAGALIRDRAVVSEIRDWFETRLGGSVEPAWLAKCAAAFRPPRTWNVRHSKKTQVRRSKSGSRVWLVPVVTDEVKRPAEDRLESTGERAAKKHLSRPRLNEVNRIRYPGRLPFTVGDHLIQLDWDGKRVRVEPHGRLLKVKRGLTARGSEVSHLFVEQPRRFRTLSLRAFRRICSRAGLRAALRWRCTPLELRDRVTAQQVLLATSPERLRR